MPKKKLARAERIEQERQIAEARGYYWIHAVKQEFKKHGVKKKLKDLLALSPNNDPFFKGSPADVVKTRWFKKLWQEKFKDRIGVHLRGIHYILFGDRYKKLDGKQYENTKKNWTDLQKVATIARILRDAPAESFDDHRAEDPHQLSWRAAFESEPTVKPPYQLPWTLPSFRVDLSAKWSIDAPSVNGYDPDDYKDRAYYLELWIEKSVSDDVLVPLCDELGVRFVPGLGFQSISNQIKLCQRAREIQKPVRVFFVSDCDKAGRNMPIAVSRGVEYWRKYFCPDADIKVQPIALTKEQVAKLHLPADFEGDGVEIDSLVVLHPGALEQIVRDAVAPYLDATINDRLQDAESEARQIVRDEWIEATKIHKQSLQALQKSVQAVTKAYEKEAAALNKRLQHDLKRFKMPLSKLQRELEKRSLAFHPALPERPTQELTGQDESNWLFDSSRLYFDQLEFYKARQSRESKQ